MLIIFKQTVKPSLQIFGGAVMISCQFSSLSSICAALLALINVRQRVNFLSFLIHYVGEHSM
jgi:hypothetical protein